VQKYSPISLFLGACLSTIFGALAFYALIMNLSTNSLFEAKAPWAISSIFLLPITLCIQLLISQWSLKSEQDDLKKTEVRRLRALLEQKNKHIYFCLAFYVFSFTVTMLLFSLVSQSINTFKYPITIVGGLVGLTLYSICWIIHEKKEISDFKAAISDRKRQHENQKRRKERFGND